MMQSCGLKRSVLIVLIWYITIVTCSIQVRWWQTEDKSGDRLTEKVPIELSEQIEIGDTIASIEIDGSKEYQRILGFGGAFTQAAASVWQKLDKKKQEDLIAAYFDPERGIGYTFGRVPINSCDFSPDTYSFDNVPGDYALNFFDELVQVDADRIIPMIKSAFKFTQKLKILASPWSPPAWMKSNNNMLKGGKVNKTDDMDVWARYIMKWISAYQNYEIPIWGLTVQNEPESAQAWESCEYKPHEQAVFVDEFLGPYLTVNHPHVSLFGFDHNKNHLYKWAETLFTNTSYFDGIAFHWYAGACFTQIQRVAHDFPDKILLPSEACYELAQIPKEFFNPDTFLHHGNWARGEGYADDILKDLHAGSHGWIDWNLILDETGGPNHVGNLCDAPVLADVKFGQGDLYFHPQYFYLGHFSKFILPQSIRLGLNIQANASLTKLDHFDDCMGWPVYGACHPGSLKSVAFRRPDGQIALVVMNCNDHALDFRLSYKGLGSFKNIIPAHAIQTYLIPDLSTLFLPPPFNFLTLSTRSRLRALFSNSFSSLLFGIIFIISLSTFIYKGRQHRGSRRQP
uniref:Glycosyl hydrolase family 30 TIM-barrel domain-containing protein n=1 Tax=Aureoumbra lagunensis TaxID=44058 RepID=A0A7S3JYT7_9STRA|mmetsp:Transcript_1601/g.2443  ORF Transcript_1601/g.2443 Transcript_1601/m.2443 type:complete len:570 (-) Transcript_1601:351-2060(-)